MGGENARLDLRKDIREALEPYVHDDVPVTAMEAVLAAVLPHFELAYKRGLMAAKSRAGYQTTRKPKEE